MHNDRALEGKQKGIYLVGKVIKAGWGPIHEMNFFKGSTDKRLYCIGL